MGVVVGKVGLNLFFMTLRGAKGHRKRRVGAGTRECGPSGRRIARDSARAAPSAGLRLLGVIYERQ